MAITFRAVGPTLKVDVGQSGGSQSVTLPTGHVAGDYLMLFVLSDDSTGPTATPPGWTKGVSAAAKLPTQVPYSAPPRVSFYGRVDSGSLGSSVPLTFDTRAWPTGSPYVLAFVVAYIGVDTSKPIEQWWWQDTSSTAAAMAHHTLTTSTANDWLVHYRASSAAASATFTNSVGTDVERLDDTALGELSCALYDTNAGVATGTQTARTTTASRTCDYGSFGISIALKAPTVTGSTTTLPDFAGAGATAYNPTVRATDGGWDTCGTGGLPSYRFAVDWDGLPGPLNSNPDFENAGGWTAYGGATFERSQVRAHRGVWSGLLTTGGSAGPRAEADKAPVTAGRTYRASGWVWAESAFGSGVGFSVNWYDAGGGYLSTSSSFFTPAVGAWQYGDGFFPAPAGAAQAGILLDTSGTPAAGLRIWGDEIRLDDWSATTDPASVTGQGEDVTADIVSDITVTYGRDQERQLSPASVGSAAFTLDNSKRRYSPENVSSPLFGDVDPARVMTAAVDFNGRTYPLFRGRVDDFSVHADFGQRTADFTFLDGMNEISGVNVSTGLYASQRTGALIHKILDKAGWTGGRDIDTGATVVGYWWLDGTDALTAISDLVKSEGPPAVAYVAPGNVFTFRDRHHRMLRQVSLTSQAHFHAGKLGDCTAPAPANGSGVYDLARPFTYAHGWKDIFNSVSFDVPVRAPSPTLQQVWQDTSTYSLAIGESLNLTVSGSDPFTDAQTPVPGTDILYTGPGTLSVLLSRTSGLTARLTLQAVGGSVTVTSAQVMARPIAVQQTIRVSMNDPGSVTQHGEQAYPESVPWAGPEDARAIANTILLHYAHRRPTVQIRVVSQDPAHFVQVLQRTVSDRVRITNDEMGLDDDFFVERVAHTIQRTGRPGSPPVHAVVLGCEKDLDSPVNPFMFDMRGSGFDQGVFDPLQADDASQVFIFDDPAQGQFDRGEFGT